MIIQKIASPTHITQRYNNIPLKIIVIAMKKTCKQKKDLLLHNLKKTYNQKNAEHARNCIQIF